MRTIYTEILDRLVSQVPALKMVEFDLGQLVQETLPGLNYPAALIRIDVNDLEELAGRAQQGVATITLTLVFRTFERTHSIASAANRAKGLEHLDVIEKVKWALHGFAGSTFTPLSHQATTSADRVELRAYPMIFTTLVTETPPADQAAYVPWGQADGTTGAGPDLCLKDETQSLLQ